MTTAIIILAAFIVLFVAFALIASKPAPAKKSTHKTPLKHMVEVERKMFGKLSKHK